MDVVINMFPVNLGARARHMYSVDFNVEVETRRRKEYLIKTFLESKNIKAVYDGEKILYATEKIPEPLSGEVVLTKEGNEKTVVVVGLKPAGIQTTKLDKPGLAFFCTQFRSAMASQTNREQIGNDYFDFREGSVQNLPELNCQLVPGLDCTIYLTKSGPLLNADFVFKHVRTDTVWDLMSRYQNREEIITEFTNRIVIPWYGDKKRGVHIDNVRFDLTPKSTFKLKDGKTTTYADYFRQKYNLTDSTLDRDQPLLESISKREKDANGQPKISLYIPSLVNLTGLTNEMRRDNMRMRTLLERMAVPPYERLSRIMSNVNSIVSDVNFQSQMQPWGMSISTSLLRVPARRLPTPELKNGQGPIEVKPDSESWDIRFRWPMFRSQPFDKWVVVCQRTSNEVCEFINCMMKIARDLNIPMVEPRYENIQGPPNPRSYEQTLLNQVKPLSPTFVMVVLPRSSEEPYKKVKQILCDMAGVPSQVVTEFNIQKSPMTKATKVVVQMNVKAGGAPWTATLGVPRPTMFVGLDIHHGGDLEHKGGSVSAFVASLDKNCTEFYSRTMQLKPRQQIHEANLKAYIKEAIEAFKSVNNNVAPVSIVVYRDGGSEGELEYLSKHEVLEVQKGITDAGLKQCTLTFIVVLKKLRTRFFSINPENPNEVGNPLPGTIIDTNVVSTVIPEFLIVCQHVNQGSATPTKYQKIYDNSSITPDELQRWTYGLAHMYFNWFGTVRTPCVLKYASTLAKFTGMVLRGREANSKLRRKVFYL